MDVGSKARGFLIRVATLAYYTSITGEDTEGSCLSELFFAEEFALRFISITKYNLLLCSSLSRKIIYSRPVYLELNLYFASTIFIGHLQIELNLIEVNI